jgi:Lrp/AsnC family leucine-responsive transcriptional regulator
MKFHCHRIARFSADNFSMIELDATDLRLLDLLQTDASLSNQALAERAHTSPATALRRVRRLVDDGVIERRVALLSPRRWAKA